MGINHEINPKAFTDYSQTIDDVYENLKNYNSTKKRKLLISDIEANKKLKPIAAELFMRERKLNISELLLYHNFILQCLKL